MIIESGLLAANYKNEFEEMWNSGEGFFSSKGFGPDSPATTPNTKISFDTFDLENYFAPEDRVMNKILEEVSKAQASVHIMAFSFTSVPLAGTGWSTGRPVLTQLA